MTEAWIILRTASGNTVRLAQTLADGGYGAWTPTETRVRRVGRARERKEIEAPILPPFVFAPAERLRELLTLSHSPALTYQRWDSDLHRMVTVGYPVFTVFRNRDQFPIIPDAKLQPLRQLEVKLRLVYAKQREAERRVGKPPQFEAGSVVRVMDGAFGGLDLVVAETNEGKVVKLNCEGWTHPLEISAWFLHSIASSSK